MSNYFKIIPSVYYFFSLILIIELYFNKISVIFGVFFVIFPFLLELIFWWRNKTGYVDIKTPDGSNQPYHPSVLYFKDGWKSFKYWMAYTPFPINAVPYQDRWEYPCIAVSNDGVNWVDHHNNKPLDDLSEEQINNKDYFSDTHLVYNPEKDRLECYYRLSEENKSNDSEKGVWIFRRYTSNGTNWTEREIVISPWENTPEISGSPCISPSIIIDGNYKMWYVVSNSGELMIRYTESKNGLNWQESKECSLTGLNINPWHIDCNKFNNDYYMLVYDFTQKLTLWISHDGVNFKFYNVILTPSHQLGSFYKSTLYRSCVVKDENGYKVYFSSGNERKVRIGLLQGAKINNLCVVNASNNGSFIDFLKDYIMKYFYLERWFLWKIFGTRHKKFFKE